MAKVTSESLGIKVSGSPDTTEADRDFGQIAARALALWGHTQQEAADRTGYANQSPMSKLSSGIGTLSTLAKLWHYDHGFRMAWIEACAEKTPEFVVRISIEGPRRRKAAV